MILHSDEFRPFGKLVYWSGSLKNTFQVFFFSCITTKNVVVAINNFTMHLIILKWLRIQKWRQNSKTYDTKKSKRKKKLPAKVFSFIYLRYRSCKYSLVLLHIYTALCNTFCTTCCIALLRPFHSYQILIPIQFFYFNIWIFLNHLPERVFHDGKYFTKKSKIKQGQGVHI